MCNSFPYDVWYNLFTGSCLCRGGITGTLCNEVMQGMFVPSFNYYILEAENAQGFYNKTSQQSPNHNKEFTGFGFALLSTNGSISFEFSAEFTTMYDTTFLLFLQLLFNFVPF